MKPDDSWGPNSPAWAERLAFVRRVLSSSHYELTREDREELAQEALVDLFERSRSERPRNPEGLLRTIAHRKAVDRFRERTRWRRILDGSEPPEDAPDPRPSARALASPKSEASRRRSPRCSNIIHLSSSVD